MTELYSLSVISEHALRRGCRAVQEMDIASPSISSKCLEAFDIVGSISILIAKIWRAPEDEIDGKRATISFYGSFNERYIEAVQDCVLSPIH